MFAMKDVNERRSEDCEEYREHVQYRMRVVAKYGQTSISDAE